MAEHAASPGRASSIGSLDDDWDEIGLQQRHWQSVSIEERKSVSPVIPLQQPPPPQPPSAHAEQPKKQLPPSPAQPAPKQEPQPQPLPQPPTSVPSPTQTASLPQTVPQHTLKAVSICSFNAALDADLDRALSQSSGAHSTATPTSPRSPPRPFGSSGLAARAERILDFCRSIHIVLLQEVWGPGVDILTTGLSLSHSIPSSLRSSNLPLVANTVNTLAFYFQRTGGLWVAHSRVGNWTDNSDEHRHSNATSPSRVQPRYPPAKRPSPHLNIPSIPLTVPSVKAFSVTSGSNTASRNAVRALLLDMSEAWGAGRRLLIFNLQLDPYDPVKRHLQLREVQQYIREVVLSLTSLIPLNGNQLSSSSTSLSSPRNHRRSSSSNPQPTTSKFQTRKHQSTTTRPHDEFDMIDEYAPSSPQLSTSVPPSTPLFPFDNPLLALTQHQPSQPPLPPKLLPNLQAITQNTALLISGDFNISATSPEYSQIQQLLGPSAVIKDFMAEFGETVCGDGRNRLVRAGSVLGRVDYMIGGLSMTVPVLGSGGMDDGIVKFLDLELVEGRVVEAERGEEVSGHWALVGWFRPRE